MTLIQQLKYRYAQFSVVERLISVMVLCFVIPFLIRTIFFLFSVPMDSFFSWFQLSSRLELLLTRPWTPITYGFLHSGLGHIFWNMLLLYYAGRMMVNLFKPQLFINTFFIGVLFGGLIYVFSYNFFPAFSGQTPYLQGSSAGVMAVLIFMCTYMPQQEVRLLFFNVKLIYIGLFFIILDLIQIPISNAGGHMAHLGGALWGYLYQKNYSQGNDIGSWFTKSVVFLKQLLSVNKKPLRKVYKSPKNKPSNRSPKNNQKKIDAILDKISKSGYASLTKEEKEFLFKAGKS
jgi:membrane associated rhomboid family serine protease